jgi:predicted MFS family arabinose efflux permease
MMDRNRILVVSALGTTQTLAWASSYYLPAVIADRMARDTGVSPVWIFAAFSISLAISGLFGPRVGRTIDLVGGRGVLAASNLIFATGLCLLATAHGPVMLTLGWIVMGAGMGIGLYDTAFATLGRLYGETARSSITGITLIAGFASTVGWPLTAWGADAFGWRETCLAWATAHIVLGLPLNWFGLPVAANIPTATAPAERPSNIVMDRTMWLLAFAFAAGWFVSTAMAAHLPRILEAAGATPVQAIAAGALIGPAQVAARMIEAGFLKNYHPLLSARLATLAHPIGAAIVLIGGGAFASAFAVLHGAGNGILTIARGTVPLALYGQQNYGYRLGLIGAPARIAQAGSPLIFSFAVEYLGGYVLIVSAALCAAASLALLAVGSKISEKSDQ